MASVDELVKALQEGPDFSDTMTLKKYHYVTFITAELVKAVKNDNVVYHGLAGHLLLNDVPHILRVKIIAKMEYRIKAAMAHKKMSPKDAVKYIREMDISRDKWVRYMYNVDRNDDSIYELIINLDRINIDFATELICSTAMQYEFQQTPESKTRMDDVLLAAELKTKIAASAQVRDDELTVTSDHGRITIGGKIDSLIEEEKVKEIIENTPEFKDVFSNVQVLY